MKLLNFKLVFYKFSTRDCFALEEYLNEMLEKGWVFEKFLMGLLFFKRTNDKNKKYHFVFDDKDNLAETLEIRNKKYEELGYDFIGISDGISIYSIDEDKNQFKSLNSNKECLRQDKHFFENIAYHMLKGKFSIIVCFIFIFSMNLYQTFSLNDVSFIANNEILVASIIFILCMAKNVLKYFKLLLWKIKSLKEINEGEKIYYPDLSNFKRKEKISNIFRLSLVLFVLIIGVLSKDIYLILGVVIIIAFLAISVLIHNLIIINEKNKNRKISKTIVVIISLFVIIITTFSIIAVYEEKDEHLKVYTDGYPLKIEDLGYESAGKRKPFLYVSESESILAKRLSYSENGIDGHIYLSYVIMESEYDWVMEYILQKNLENEYSDEFEIIDIELPDDITIYKNNLDNFIFVSSDKLVNTFKVSRKFRDREFANLIYEKIFKNNINE